MAQDDPTSPSAEAPPLLVCLHWLGGSGRTWSRVAAALAPDLRVLAVDLPGFGDAAHQDGASVDGMVRHAAEAIRPAKGERWMLAGHSMGAKVALALARRAEDGDPDLAGLTHLVLLAGSPPSPEPMDEDRRRDMLGWFGGHPDQSRREAQTLIDGNVGSPLDAERNADVAADILRLNRDAWTSWLERGSREDWADRIGVLQTPALVVAGGKDGDLGPDGQRRLMAGHLSALDLVVMPDAGHLLPVERPEEVADLIRTHVLGAGPGAIPASYRALIGSDRVSARVRELLLGRAQADDPAREPKAMSHAQMTTLRALVDRIVPQAEPGIDIAARMDEGLGTEPGDGWRFSDLPSDQDTYRSGLETLNDQAQASSGAPFDALAPEAQDGLIAALPNGKGSTGPAPGAGRLSPHQMALWFEDVRANAVRVYMSHPRTMARYGYSGIGYGGDVLPLPGFSAVGLNEVEAWEPRASTEAGR